MPTQMVTRALSRLRLDQRGTDPFPRQPVPILLQKADPRSRPQTGRPPVYDSGHARRSMEAEENITLTFGASWKGARRWT